MEFLFFLSRFSISLSRWNWEIFSSITSRSVNPWSSWLKSPLVSNSFWVTAIVISISWKLNISWLMNWINSEVLELLFVSFLSVFLSRWNNDYSSGISTDARNPCLSWLKTPWGANFSSISSVIVFSFLLFKLNISWLVNRVDGKVLVLLFICLLSILLSWRNNDDSSGISTDSWNPCLSWLKAPWCANGRCVISVVVFVSGKLDGLSWSDEDSNSRFHF